MVVPVARAIVRKRDRGTGEDQRQLYGALKRFCQDEVLAKRNADGGGDGLNL